MVTKNDITGDMIKSKVTTQSFRDGWDRIFNHEQEDVLIEKTEDNGVLIFAGSKVFVKLTQNQFNNLVKKILTQITAEQIAYAMRSD